MNKDLILEQLINFYSDGNKSLFAKKLGIKPQTVNSWLKRKTFDYDLIYANCENISGDWLLSGKGEMLRADSDSPSVSLSGNHNQVNGHGASGNINGTAEVAALLERNKSLESVIKEKDALISTLRHQSETYERTIKYFTENK